MLDDHIELLGLGRGGHQRRRQLHELLAFRQGLDIADRIVVGLQLLEQQVTRFGHILELADDVNPVESLGLARLDRAAVDEVDQGPQQLPAKTKAATSTASPFCPAPANAPTAAQAHKVAAVFSPLTCAPSFMMTPAPRKPIPDTT